MWYAKVVCLLLIYGGPPQVDSMLLWSPQARSALAPQCSLHPKRCPLQTTRRWVKRGMLWLATRQQCRPNRRWTRCWSTMKCLRCGVQRRQTASSSGPPGSCCALQPAGCVYGGMWPASAGVHIGQAALLVGTSVQESGCMLLVVWDLLSPKPSSTAFLDAPLIPPWL